MSLPNFTDGQEGTVYDLPDADYRKASGVSNSMLKNIALDGDEPGSPAHFVQSFLDPKTDTDALFIGRMVHSRILTPDEPLPGVVEIPESFEAKGQKNTNAYKAWKETQEAAGLRVMKASDIKAMDGMVKAVAEDPTCQVIFQEGRAEVSCFKRWHNQNGMVLRKMRADWVPTGPTMVDMKSCLDARAVDFDRVIWARGYYRQFAYYLDIWNELNPGDRKENFAVIAVEKFPPYAIQVFVIDPQDLEDGRREYRRNLALVVECMKSGVWPGYPTGPQPIKMRVPYNRKNVLPT